MRTACSRSCGVSSMQCQNFCLLMSHAWACYSAAVFLAFSRGAGVWVSTSIVV